MTARGRHRTERVVPPLGGVMIGLATVTPVWLLAGLLAFSGTDTELRNGSVAECGALCDTAKRADGPLPKTNLDRWGDSTSGVPEWLLPDDAR